MKTYSICIRSINPECNKDRGPFASLEKARTAAKKWKGKSDRFLFPYTTVEIYDGLKLVETVIL